jgi:hypothetical protein
LNKDAQDRPLWDEAYVFAYAATHELVAAMAKWAETERPGFWNSILQYSVNEKDRARLDKDIRAARSMSMWIEAKGQDGTWKGDGSGTQRLFSLFSSKWVTADTSDVVKAVRDGKLQNDLIKGLYEKRRDTALPEMEPFDLDRNALLVRMTNVKLIRNSNLWGRVSRNGSDYYSRMMIGEQEFWGRTLQSIRQADDPWYEIFFADGSLEEVPILISLWDEDSIDPTEDEHVDINPAPGKYDLKMIFRLSDGLLSGDLSGIFDSPKRSFRSEGAKPENDRAGIQGYVSVRKLILYSADKK